LYQQKFQPLKIGGFFSFQIDTDKAKSYNKSKKTPQLSEVSYDTGQTVAHNLGN
jgi:hypothetical protein